MRVKAVRRALVLASLGALTLVGAAPAGAQDERGIDPNQGRSLVEVTLDSRAAAMRLQLEADTYGVEFNDHYLRRNDDGTVTATVFGYKDELEALENAGYDLGVTIEGPATWREQTREYLQDVRKEKRADAAALEDTVGTLSHQDEVVILRADYFENYAGRFLSVEAKTRLGGAAPTGSTYVGPDLSLSFNRGGNTPIDSPPRLMSTNIDPDTTPDTYIEHRELVRIGEVGTTDPPRPSRIRVGSSTGESLEAEVETWLGGGLPPMKDDFIRDFTTRYMDPTEVYAAFEALEDEFPNLAELITLPYKTNGYQRRAQATMAGATGSGNTPPTALQAGAVVLTSRAWGHEGGNSITAEFRNPNAPSSPLTVTRNGNHVDVLLGTDPTGALASTGQQVVDAINASPASEILVANVFTRVSNTDPPIVPGTGIVQPRALVGLSDFLTTATNAHVQRGPFEYSVMRIGKKRKHHGKWKDKGRHGGDKVGVFLFCQQHAREWATPLTCLETASQLLYNYATDRRTRKLVDNLDIFILPSSNPDGSHFSIHNFAQQRRNMTNHCVVGGKETDNPSAANFWTAQTPVGGTTPFTAIDPAARQAWGVDLNRNNTFGTLFDGYIGASTSCISDVYAGPAEASEPEIRNELWVADTFDNIKFSNNIHSFGGYFMWAPGTYLPDRGEGDAVHANIGVEKYFFEAGDRILNRIKEHRNTAILPERTGPIADVLYSAAGNSADEHWYNRGVIAYSFETGADRYFTNAQATAPAGAPGIRISTNTTGFQYLKPGDILTVGAGGPNPERRTVASIVRPNPPSPQPNVLFTQPLAFTHTVSQTQTVRIEGAALQTGVGFQPDYATEGKHEALEFAAGNYGLLESALEYARDDEDPKVRMTGPKRSRDPIETTFEWINEPSVIRYTTNGKWPTDSSALWDSTGPREPGETFHLTRSTTFRWKATDMKGNVSYGKQEFRIGRWWDDD
jgi:Zinc carboxypeptidase/Chitobiase/beta-hexosaminidase C-terminal domain